MKTFFDSSVLASLINQQSPFNAAAVKIWQASSQRMTSCHALAETYRTVTTVAKPVPPKLACQQLARLAQQMDVCPSLAEHYLAATTMVAEKAMGGPVVYDALHVECARRNGADLIVTRNKAHFDRFADGLAVEEL